MEEDSYAFEFSLADVLPNPDRFISPTRRNPFAILTPANTLDFVFMTLQRSNQFPTRIWTILRFPNDNCSIKARRSNHVSIRAPSTRSKEIIIGDHISGLDLMVLDWPSSRRATHRICAVFSQSPLDGDQIRITLSSPQEAKNNPFGLQEACQTLSSVWPTNSPTKRSISSTHLRPNAPIRLDTS
jgi:hypothetical protein